MCLWRLNRRELQFQSRQRRRLQERRIDFLRHRRRLYSRLQQCLDSPQRLLLQTRQPQKKFQAMFRHHRRLRMVFRCKQFQRLQRLLRSPFRCRHLPKRRRRRRRHN